jgi:riboflavin synthase
MFTGIVEATGFLKKTVKEGSNIRITIDCPFSNELKIDQSVACNGVCLTVVSFDDKSFDVIAIDETLKRSNLGLSKSGDAINLERSIKVNDRLDGHIVQGHVDTMGETNEITSENGSWLFSFSYDETKYITVEKGSVCVNGVSLTVVESGKNYFSVAIIPYTMEHTNFGKLKKGERVNIEFDIVGKYIAKMSIG